MIRLGEKVRSENDQKMVKNDQKVVKHKFRVKSVNQICQLQQSNRV